MTSPNQRNNSSFSNTGESILLTKLDMKILAGVDCKPFEHRRLPINSFDNKFDLSLEVMTRFSFYFI